MIAGLGWANLVCSRCRAPLSPLAPPNVYAVHHMPGCGRRCFTVCELADQSDGTLRRTFRHPATTAEPRHLGCRWCDQRAHRSVRNAARRRDFEAVRVLTEWGRGEAGCRCSGCASHRDGAR